MSRRARVWLWGPPLAWIVVAAGGVLATAASPRSWEPVSARGDAVGSEDCRRCHAAQYETWHDSYHRTMTQPASAGVLAPFEGETLQTAGFVATMDRDAKGRPRITVHRDEAVVFEAEVELSVGSHRYQQYVARIDRGGGPRERWRLPFAWHPQAGRWIHLGGAFLFSDLSEGDTQAYFRHLSRWNDNCVFCHNTEPSPGLREDGRFETTLVEFGIGCEACHGAAQAHVARQTNPFRRMLAGVARERGDATITHPARLDPARHSEVCGRCHGQRIGHDLADILAHGDRFQPGERLDKVSRPIFADARLASDPEHAKPFATRFWPDGTPRLSAYEYQGLLLSPCYDQGRGLSCGDCHTMHGPKPAMQLREGADTSRACLGECHEASAYAEHGGHDAVSCQACHMPRTTYGLLRGMASHRITAPDPAAWLGRDDHPDACTLCHVDRSRAWAADSMSTLGLEGTPHAAPMPPQVGSQVERDLVGGDPIQRALAAHALSRPDAVGEPSMRLRALIDGLEDDYPAVRWFAHRGALAVATRTFSELLPTLQRYDFMADVAERLPVVDTLRAALGPSTIANSPSEQAALQARRDDVAIAIGE